MIYSFGMSNAQIFQIFYDAQTKKSLDPDFLPLDNLENSRPDWREYWPMRNYLLNNALDENCFYGFFSPKFKEKTGLSANDCLSFIGQQKSDLDVITFSPLFDLGAWFRNSFLQAISLHPNSTESIIGALHVLNPYININELVMHSGNNIFCNFFVAKPAFWKAWLENCELIWAEAEFNMSSIAHGLNSLAQGHDSPAPIKTFVIERIASLMLATNDSWKVRAYNSLDLPFSSAPIANERAALIQLDALKIAYADQKRAEYLSLHKTLGDLVLKKVG
ncbi:hypothetical protein [Polynucleobacter asymbioticus]|nr:hypothetical protein [Polynucleobacter asymbioticus]